MIAKRILETEDPTFDLAQEICALARADFIRSCSHLGLEHWAYNWFSDLSDGFTKARKDRLWAEVKKQLHVWPKQKQEV